MKAALTTIAVMLLAVSAALASVRAYAVDPVKAAWSSKVPGQAPYGGVAQTVTCCWDSLDAVHLFCGARGDTNARRPDVPDGANGARRAA